MGLQLINSTATGTGNYVAFDTPSIVDVTPQLDKLFSPSTIPAGGTSDLVFTITNTTDLAAKTAWTFTDKLPTGVTATGSNSTTCTGATITAGSGAGTVNATGNVDQGVSSCTISVQVTASTPGTYTNTGCTDSGGNQIAGCTSNITSISGLNPPGSTTLTVQPNVNLAITKTANVQSYTPGQPITYTVKITNTGISTASGARVTDPLPASISSAAWTCSATAASSCPASGTGNINSLVTLVPNGSVTFTVTGTVAVGTTGTLANTATVVPPAAATTRLAPGTGTGCSAGATTPGSGISITKTSSTVAITRAGQQVPYSFAVKNTGQSTLTGIAVTDVQLAPATQGNLWPSPARRPRWQPWPA